MVHDVGEIKKAIEELDKALQQTKTLRLYLMQQYELVLEIEKDLQEQTELDLKLDADKKLEKQEELKLK
jgi:hypothetical protein